VGGAVALQVTLSEDNIERGIRATRDVVDEWARGGLTQAELEEKKTTLAGTYTVGLSTTGGLAAQAHRLVTTGFELAYLDAYPDHVAALGLDAVNGAIAVHVRPDALVTALAGPVEEAE
jgi:predicted Zn-dependent peptidase